MHFLLGFCLGICVLTGQIVESSNTNGTRIYTPNAYKYVNLEKYGLRLTDTFLVFDVQACNDAHIGLFSNDPSIRITPMYEIVIGGWSNAKSAIRNRKQGTPIVVYRGRLLDCSRYKTFWIRWTSGLVQVGTGNQTGKDKFMQWRDRNPHTVRYVGISTGWGAEGNWIFNLSNASDEREDISGNGGELTHIFTPDLYKYVSLEKYGLRITNTSLVFDIEACNDAHIGLFSHDPSVNKSSLYEIVIGGWSNTKSAIRNYRQASQKALYFGRLLNCNRYNTFWISWTSGLVQVGRGNVTSKNTFMNWTDGHPHTVRYVGISTGWGSEGNWIFNATYGFEVVSQNDSKPIVPSKGDFIRLYTKFQKQYLSLDSFGFHVNDSILVFEVQACSDAFIALFTHTKGFVYEIAIGGWKNTKSIIRNGTSGSSFKAEYIGKLLDCFSYRPFWITWTSWVIRVGRGNIVGENIFMKWVVTAPHLFKYAAVSTGWGSDGNWIFNISYNVSTSAREDDGLTHIFTPDLYKYVSLEKYGLRITDTFLVFDVEACNDAHIGLFSHDPSVNKSSLYEIVIGGWSNTISAIRNYRLASQKALYNGRLLDCHRYKTFWISWTSGLVQVGRGNLTGHNIFMHWTDVHPHTVRYVGISTGWGAQGSWIFNASYGMEEISTNESSPLIPSKGEDFIRVYTKFQKQYLNLDSLGFPINDSILVFEVQACHDVHIGLFSHSPDIHKGYVYEIAIGGWKNTKSIIRDRFEGSFKAVYHGKLLNCTSYKSFWLSWTSGFIQVGRGKIVGEDIFMEWADRHPHSVNYAAVSTGWGSDGNWLFNISYSVSASAKQASKFLRGKENGWCTPLNPCQHQSRCISNSSTYKCYCNSARSYGAHCERQFVTCEFGSFPCQNRAECTKDKDGYDRCFCRVGFKGDYCDIETQKFPKWKEIFHEIDSWNGFYYHGDKKISFTMTLTKVVYGSQGMVQATFKDQDTKMVLRGFSRDDTYINFQLASVSKPNSRIQNNSLFEMSGILLQHKSDGKLEYFGKISQPENNAFGAFKLYSAKVDDNETKTTALTIGLGISVSMVIVVTILAVVLFLLRKGYIGKLLDTNMQMAYYKVEKP